MLLWITENAARYDEPENVIIRTPEALSHISPNSILMVLIELPNPIQELLAWGENRSLPTLWWQPEVRVPKGHCVVRATDCDCREFACLLGLVCLREGVVNFDYGELESAIRNYSCMTVVPYKRLRDGDDSHRQCVLGYFIQRGIEGSLETFKQKFEWVKKATAISKLYTLLFEEIGTDMVWTFSSRENQYYSCD